MTDATFRHAFVDFEIEYQLAQSELEAAIASATSSLEFPSRRDLVARSKIEDLHADVSDAIETGLKRAS